MSIQEKFQAAVNVIRSLPKNGPYQPSNELMLRLYAYFKQATKGPCTGSRPSFFHIVARAKYDAWKKLEKMPYEVAMQCYVEELQQIVETMSYSENVADFLDATNDMNLPEQDVELVFGDVIKRFKLENDSPIISRNVSPSKFNSNETSNDSDDEFADTLEPSNNNNCIPMNLSQDKLKSNEGLTLIYESNCAMMKTMQDLDRKLDEINVIIKKIESMKILKEPKSNNSLRNFFRNQTTHLIMFMILWPILLNFIKRKIIKNR